MSMQCKKRSCTSEQTLDPKTGRPLIESLMEFREFEPKPRPKPTTKRIPVYDPKPWLLSKTEKEKLAKMRADLREAEERRAQRELEARKRAAYQPREHQVVIPPRTAPAATALGTVPLGGPAGKGAPAAAGGAAGVGVAKGGSKAPMATTLKVLETFTPPCNPRQLPPEAHEHIHVVPLGSNRQPPDGHHRPIPPPFRCTETAEEEYDCVAGVVKPKPKPKKCGGGGGEEEEEGVKYNVLGAEVVRPQSGKRPALAKEATESDAARRESDHYSKVMARTKLVDMVRAEQHAEANRKAAAAAHTDPLAEVDIFGRPACHHSHADSRKKKMFPTDSEPLRIFGQSAEPRMGPARERTGLPAYIAAPPAEAGPLIEGADGEECPHDEALRIVSQRQPQRCSKAESRLKAFYASPLYRTIIFKSKGWGIRALRHALHSADRDGDSVLRRSELLTVLRKFGIDLDDAQLETLISLAPAKRSKCTELRKNAAAASRGVNRYAKPPPPPPPPPPAKGGTGAETEAEVEASHCIFIPRLMDVLRRELGAPRRMIIESAYRVACAAAEKNPSDGLPLDELENVVNFAAHPSYQAHVRGCLREVIAGFNAAWGARKSRNSVIVLEEFVSFFHDVSASYLTDADFIKMMKGIFAMQR